jgi:cell cycle sensor histidine kinase DivJ
MALILSQLPLLFGLVTIIALPKIVKVMLGGGNIFMAQMNVAKGVAMLAAAAATGGIAAVGLGGAAAAGAAMYRFLADNAMDLITRHSPDGRIRFASPAAHALLGVEPQELLGMAPAALAYAEDLKIMQAAFVEASYFGRAATAEGRRRG